MFFLRLVFCCLTIYSVSEGTIVPAIIGQNVSLSWTFNIIWNDAIHILHNGSSIHRVFPNSNTSVPLKPPQQGSITVDFTKPEKVTVAILFLNITTNDAGTYRVVRQKTSEDLHDSFELQMTGINVYSTTPTIWKKDTEGINHYTTMETNQKEDTDEISSYMATKMRAKEDTKGINHYTTSAVSQKVYIEGTNHYTTSSMIPDVDANGTVGSFPTVHHLLYIVLGMGGILAIVFIACLLHKIRICLRADDIPNSTNSSKGDEDETIQEENLPGNYWTIISNERGELSTAIETDVGVLGEQPALVQTMVPTNNESNEVMRHDITDVNGDVDAYLNPVLECPVEFDEYIHPIHSYPVECDEYIHPVHSEHVKTDFISTLHTDRALEYPH